jgi:DNA-binding NarL/FixJ family response regulator
VDHEETPSLTPDEYWVRRFFVQGRKLEEMAATLGVSPDEVREHVQSVLTKFQVRSRFELRRKTGWL